MSQPASFLRSSIGRKLIMAFTGVILFGFVIGHMVGNLQVFLGPDQINAYGNFLQSTPELLWSARLGLLVMVTRRNAVSQVVGFMSLENGLVLAATGAKGMPLVVEISVAFSILVALIVIGIFLFRIRERFDSVDVHALDRVRVERI